MKTCDSRKITYSSILPEYLGLGTSIILRLSDLHLTMCMNWSKGVDGGFVVYTIWASSKLSDSVCGSK